MSYLGKTSFLWGGGGMLLGWCYVCAHSRQVFLHCSSYWPRSQSSVESHKPAHTYPSSTHSRKILQCHQIDTWRQVFQENRCQQSLRYQNMSDKAISEMGLLFQLPHLMPLGSEMAKAAEPFLNFRPTKMVGETDRCSVTQGWNGIPCCCQY